MSVWQPLIVCGVKEGTPDVPVEFFKSCGFEHLILLAKNLITDLVILSTFLAMAAFVYVGFLLLTSGGKESAKTKAKDVFMKVIIGYLWILGAWLLIYTITSVLLKDNFLFLLGAPK